MVIDVGANVGIYTFQLARAVGPSGRVLAVEPFPASARLLRWGLRLQGFQNTTLVEKALDEREGPSFMSSPERRFGGYGDALVHLSTAGTRFETPVVCSTLDALVAEHRFKTLDFLKCDVEGAEWRVLSGGRAALMRTKPNLLIEVDPRWSDRYGHTQDEVLGFATELVDGRAMVYENRRLVPRLAATRPHSNFVIVHR